MLADRLGIDPWEIIELANRHPRVNILSPGPGVGGHCISVDPWFLVHADPAAHAVDPHGARSQRRASRITWWSTSPNWPSEFAAPKIGCLGLTYKADVDDLRESPSLEIVRELHEQACRRNPGLRSRTSRASGSRSFRLHELSDVLEQSHILVLLTDHRQFKNVPRRILQEKVVVDTRGIWR